MAQQLGGELASNGVFGRLLAHLERQGCCASGWFHDRPSATVDLNDSTKAAPYNAANTSASNLGPTSKALEEAQPELAGKAHPSDVLDIVFGPRSRRHAGQCVPSGRSPKTLEPLGIGGSWNSSH